VELKMAKKAGGIRLKVITIKLPLLLRGNSDHAVVTGGIKKYGTG
jgi:hypothetical protein